MFSRAAVWIYLGAFFSLIAAGLGFPIPEELPIVVSGAMVGHASEDPALLDAVSQAVTALDASPEAPFPWVGLIVSSQVEVPPIKPPVRLLSWHGPDGSEPGNSCRPRSSDSPAESAGT